MWRETPHTINRNEWHASVRDVSNRLALQHGLPILDAYSVLHAADSQKIPRKAIWWDAGEGAKHPWQYVYENINDVLLNMLCDSNCGWRGVASADAH